MSISSTSSGEFLDVKVFLYKYTPQFNFESDQTQSIESKNAQGKTETTEGTYQVTKYSIDLNAPKYFSKFDLTQYLSSYQFKQGLYGNVYDWNLSFQDAVIPFAQLDPNGTATVRKVATFRNPRGKVEGGDSIRGPWCRPNQDFVEGDLVELMAEYEAESNWPTSFGAEVDTIVKAYLARGTIKLPYASNSQGATGSVLNAPGSNIILSNPKLNGIRLSDLVQKYNYVSVFVYKSSVHPDQARQVKFPKGVLYDDNAHRPFDPSNEVHLMLQGYKNEFNGFVTGKNFTRTTGGVDKVGVTGHGSLRLFSDTTTLFDPSILTKGIFDASTLSAIAPSAQLEGSDATQQYYSLFQNLFQGDDPIQILTKLLFMMYKITFNGPIAVPSLSKVSASEYRGFYDIHQLALLQSGSSQSVLSVSAATTTNKAGNLVTIAPFLLALTMALRNYDYNLLAPLQPQPAAGGTPVVSAAPDHQFTPVNPKELMASRFAEEFGGPCVQISAVDKIFTPFFKMLKNGAGNFLSGLKTPSQIMADATVYSMLEFFERPNGRIVLRTPQYNQPARTVVSSSERSSGVDSMGNSVTSTSIPIVQATYQEDGTQLQSQKRGSWAVDLAGTLGGGLIQPSYGNGKLMMQYGFREATAEPNPVLSSLALSKSSGALTPVVTVAVDGSLIPPTPADINSIVHKYLRFLLEFDNAGLRTGSLSLEGDPQLEVGKLFFDYTNNKVGYIVDVQKQLTVGQTYTASIGLKFVRDMTDAGTNFRQLPTLEELATAGNAFLPGAQSTPITEFPSVPPPQPTGTTSQQLFNNLLSGLKANPLGNTQ